MRAFNTSLQRLQSSPETCPSICRAAGRGTGLPTCTSLQQLPFMPWSFWPHLPMQTPSLGPDVVLSVSSVPQTQAGTVSNKCCGRDPRPTHGSTSQLSPCGSRVAAGHPWDHPKAAGAITPPLAAPPCGCCRGPQALPRAPPTRPCHGVASPDASPCPQQRWVERAAALHRPHRGLRNKPRQRTF